jgi:transcriptional regulator with XRE-family HTH domain
VQVGEKIRQLRIHRKMTQSELVEGISSVAYLSMIENGKSKPSKSFLYLIAQRLNVEVEALLSPTHSDSNERINEIVDRFKRFGTLTESDLSYLRISAMEIQTPCVYLKIFGVLLRYYTHHGEIKEKKFIPHL